MMDYPWGSQTPSTKGGVGPRPRTCAFVICNQLGESQQSADEKSQVQFARNFLKSKLTSAARGGTGEAGFALI